MRDRLNLRQEVEDFGVELLQNGVANPWNGIAQLINAPQFNVDSKENQESIGGQAGALVGNIADLAILTVVARRALKAIGTKAVETTAKGSALTFATAGALHGGFLTPTPDGMELINHRFKQAGLEAASMAAMGSLNSRLEPLKFSYRLPASLAANGSLGAANALVSEGVMNHRIASGSEISKQALTFGLLGGGFTALDFALAKPVVAKGYGEINIPLDKGRTVSVRTVAEKTTAGGVVEKATMGETIASVRVETPFRPFERLTDQPIVSPKPGTLYSKGAFNPTVVQTEDGMYHMLFRGQDDAGVSRVFYGSSKDGKSFKIQDEPAVLSPRLADEAKGIEDPRLSRNPDNHKEWLLTATAFDGSKPQLGIWKSLDLQKWDPITPESAVVMPLIKGVREGQTKSGVILEERIDGKMWMYLMRDYADDTVGAQAKTFSTKNSDQMTVAHSVDGVHWTEATPGPILARRPGMFDERVVEPGPPPIMTDKGILMLYNGANNGFSYKTGWALFDKNNPARLIARSNTPVLEPKLPWEIRSHAAGEVDQKGNLIFTQGLARQGDNYLIYYGGADSFIGVARTSINLIELQEVRSVHH